MSVSGKFLEILSDISGNCEEIFYYSLSDTPCSLEVGFKLLVAFFSPTAQTLRTLRTNTKNFFFISMQVQRLFLKYRRVEICFSETF